MTIDCVQFGTIRGTFWQTIGSRKIVPPMRLRSVPFGEGVHPLQVEFIHAAAVGGDAGAFDADAVLFDRVSGIDGDLVVGVPPWAAPPDARQRAASAAFSVALGRIAADVLA
jgi:hypothetical protein